MSSYLSKWQIGPLIALWKVLLIADFREKGNEPPCSAHSEYEEQRKENSRQHQI